MTHFGSNSIVFISFQIVFENKANRFLLHFPYNFLYFLFFPTFWSIVVFEFPMLVFFLFSLTDGSSTLTNKRMILKHISIVEPNPQALQMITYMCVHSCFFALEQVEFIFSISSCHWKGFSFFFNQIINYSWNNIKI